MSLPIGSDIEGGGDGGTLVRWNTRVVSDLLGHATVAFTLQT
jgi:hypothetical protein